jgi:sugar phosphate isomerase/epimerase
LASILNEFDNNGVDLVTKFTQGRFIDGETYEMFLKAVNNHSRACILYDPSHFVLQQLDYIQYIDFITRNHFMLKMQSLILPENKELLRISELG